MALIPTGAAPEDYRRKMAYKLMMEGTDASPVQHWAQGLARLGQGALGGYEMYQADERDKASEREAAQAYAALLGGGGQSAPQAASEPPAMPTPSRPVPQPPGPMVSADPQAMAGPRPGGPVQPTAKVWGDAEAEAAGLYEPQPKNVRMASALAAPEIPAQAPMPAAQPQMAQALAPQQPAQADPRKAKIIQLLSGNRAEQKMGRALADQMIAQQFKPQDYDIHHRADGTIVAVDKKDPRNVKTIAGDSQGIVNFEANKAGAVEKAKREGEVEFSASKAGAVKRAEMEAAKAVAKPEQDKQNLKVADIVTQDIDRAIKTIDTSNLPTTGATGSGLSYLGGTAAHDVSKLLDTVKSNAGFQELSKMRQASPTGAALGSVTERELALLQATIGNLEQSQSADQLKDNLRRAKNTYADIIHGEGKGPPREKLTFQQEKQSGPVTIDGYKIRAR